MDDIEYAVTLLEDIYDQNAYIAEGLRVNGCRYVDMLNLQEQLAAIADDIRFVITGIDEQHREQAQLERALYL